MFDVRVFFRYLLGFRVELRIHHRDRTSATLRGKPLDRSDARLHDQPSGTVSDQALKAEVGGRRSEVGYQTFRTPLRALRPSSSALRPPPFVLSQS